MRKFAIRKFDGNSVYSYAVFRADAVKGIRGVVFYGDADPIVSGLSRREADYYKQKFEQEFA